MQIQIETIEPGRPPKNAKFFGAVAREVPYTISGDPIVLFRKEEAMSQPGFYFYTGDWIKDTRQLSIEARGAWIDLLCALNEHGGSVTWPLRAFQQYWGLIDHDDLEYDAKEILDELVTLGICDIVTDPNGGITVTSRRIKRDFNYKENNRKRQQRFREKQSRNGAVTALGNGSSSSESSSSLKSSSKKKKIAPSHRNVTPPTLWPPDDIWLSDLLKTQSFCSHCGEQLQDYQWWEFAAKSLGGIDRPFIEKEFAKINAWWRENPTKHKTANGMRRFIRTWLEKAKNNQRRVYAIKR